MLRTVAVAMMLGAAAADTVVVAGDSWADYSGIPNTEFPAVFERHGDTRTIHNIAKSGSTCAQWATGSRLESLLHAVRPGSGVTHVWMICGGNDAQFTLAGCRPQNECIEQIVTSVTRDLGHILDEVRRTNPDVKVVSFGYDLLGFGSLVGQVLSRSILPDCSGKADCVNPAFLNIQSVFDSLAQSKSNFDSINLLGSLQAFRDVPGAAVGVPVLTEFSPNNMFDLTAIHPTREGYRVVFENFYERYWSKTKAFNANTTKA